MVSFYKLTLTAALVALGSTTPLQKRNTNSGSEVVTSSERAIAVDNAVRRSYGKFKGPPTAGTVIAQPEHNLHGYLSPVEIGTPPQTLMMKFDTGSSDFWAFSAFLPSEETYGHDVYNPFKSSSAAMLDGSTWGIAYGDGSSAWGNLYFDDVSIGNTNVANMVVGAAQNVSGLYFAEYPMSGMVGLGMSSFNTARPKAQQTFFDHAIAEGLPEPVFTANLKKGAPGNYNFGYIDDAEYTGDITYVPVETTLGFWGFNNNGYAIGNDAFVSLTINAIAATGGPLITLPDVIVQAYYDQVKGSENNSAIGGFGFPCDSALPDLTLGIGAYKAVVPGSHINWYNETVNGVVWCLGGLQPMSPADVGIAHFGNIFFQSQFVVFNSTNNPPNIGFAKGVGKT
jgi:hypothetical protein